MSLRDFGVLSDGRSVQEVTLGNGRLTAQFLTFGARINGLSFDEIDDLTPTFDLEAAAGSNPYSGVIVGPVMNRLGGARAPLNGQVLTFDANEGSNLLHSGAAGLHLLVWDIAEVSETTVTFAVDLRPDTFPGRRRIEVTYRLEDADLVLEIAGTTDAPTLMNVGFHPFWTVSGRGRAGHVLQVHGAQYLPMDGGNIPTGEVSDVVGTALDYRIPRAPADDIDHCFVLPEHDGIAPCVTLISDVMRLEILSDAPAVHVFTGMDIGIAVEPEIHPDAPNHAGFPSIRLGSGETFRQTVIHRFSRR